MAPIYRAFLEEIFDKGLIELPAGAVLFDQNPAAWCHADWIGPGRGWIDPLREAQAAGERIENNLTTLQQESAEQGRDWKMDALQRARERSFYEKLRLPMGPADVLARPRVNPADDREPGEDTEEEVNGRKSARRHPVGIPAIARRKPA
ncbi:phage portal protein, lambda family [compost metagenome]